MNTHTCCIAMSILFSTGSATAAILQVPAQYPTISQAIDASVHGDIIDLAPGWYPECIDYQGKNIRISGPAVGNAAVISGWGLDDAVVTFDDGEGPDAILENVTVAYGTGATDPLNGLKVGGGIWISKSSPRIINCRITRNVATDGGGLYVFQGSPYIEGCKFDTNAAVDCGGGMMSSESTPYVLSCIFESNRSQHGGGGLMALDQSDVEVRKCRFLYNLVADDWGAGGGMMTAYGSALVEDCQFHENSAPGGGGFGNQSGFALVKDCDFTENDAMYTGGGLTSKASLADASIEVHNCTFKQNYAPTGGGAFIANLAPGAELQCKAIIEGCHFMSNSGVDGVGLGTKYSEIHMSKTYFADNKSYPLGQAYGGGIYAWKSPLAMEDVVFRGNRSNVGGGVWHVEEVLDMSNCTFIDNLAYNGGGGLYTRESTCEDHGSMFIQNNPWNGLGGGWLMAECEVEAHGTEFKYHYASFVGSGVAASDTTLLFDSVLFQGNTSQHPGGGIWSSNCTSTFQDCEFIENDSHTKGGGGAFIGGDAQFYDTQFEYNIAQDGGALFLDGAEAEIEACSFTTNMALDLGYAVWPNVCEFKGGAIHTNQEAWIKDTFFCANVPNHIEGPWNDLLGNTISETCEPCPWDVDGNGTVDFNDAIMVWQSMNTGNCASCDVNGDGVVDINDLIEVINNIGQC